MLKGRSVVWIDYEFNRVTHPNVNLVCCATYCKEDGLTKWWLHNDKETQKSLLDYLQKFDTQIGYSCVAEGRSTIALGADPRAWEWVDLFYEYRCLSNKNDDLNYGKQLVDGKVVMTKKPKPKWERAKEDKATGFSPTHSLAEATYKLLGEIRDTEHKTAMRDLIISDPEFFTDEEQDAIMNYCAEDVVNLPRMFDAMVEKYKGLLGQIDKKQLLTEMFWRGRYAMHTAYMENRGYPLDVRKARNLSDQVGNILMACQREINSLFPDIKPFKWEKKDQKYRWDQKATKAWVESWLSANGKSRKDWEMTDSKDIALSLEAFQRYFDFKHEYPEDNFGAQIVRYLKLKQSFNGFLPAKPGKKTFWSSVGPDGRVRAYLNPYGAQSSRSQPSATGFLFLKAAWLRALCMPEPGMAMGGIDYASQEYLVSALLSRDKGMIKAYESGDVYLQFAKDAGMVPQNATKESHKYERNLAKTLVLGISYLMSKYGLSNSLTQDTGRPWSEEEAQELIDKFYEAYPDLADFQQEIQEIYDIDGYLKLADGYYMWGDNDNLRSVTNVGSQGMGACVMRKAVDLAEDRGLEVIFTLHDAIYIQYEVGEERKMKELADCMIEAFIFYFDRDQKEDASLIRLDPLAWSPDYRAPIVTLDEKGKKQEDWQEFRLEDGFILPVTNLYLDERAISEYEKFSRYFEDTGYDLI